MNKSLGSKLAAGIDDAQRNERFVTDLEASTLFKFNGRVCRVIERNLSSENKTIEFVDGTTQIISDDQYQQMVDDCIERAQLEEMVTSLQSEILRRYKNERDERDHAKHLLELWTKKNGSVSRHFTKAELLDRIARAQGGEVALWNLLTPAQRADVMERS